MANRKYTLFIRNTGLAWLWGWYLVRIFDHRDDGLVEIEFLRRHAKPGTQMALLEWTPDDVTPLGLRLYFFWPKNTKVIFWGTVDRVRFLDKA